MPKIIRTKKINVFGKGTINSIDSEKISDGASSDSLNFLTYPDKIELVRGRKLIGAEESGSNQVLGLHTVTKIDGTDVTFRKINTKLQYYNTATETWVDCKTGLLSGKKLWFANSNTPAGRQVWACGEDGLFKIYPTHPTSVIDLTDSTKNYKGKIIIDKSRMICLPYDDPTGIRFSKVDKDSNYVTITTEAITDTAIGKKHYTGTLSNGQGFGYVFKDGSAQTLTDDKNGNLIGDGTGTINYATGEYVLDFTNNTATPIVCDYLYENPLNNGLADFRYSASRLAGEGNIQRQDSIGSKSQNVLIFNNTFYTLQDKGSWWVTIDTADTKWDNQVYRLNIGTPTPDASVITADGIVYVDTFDTIKPKLGKLGFDRFNEQIIPYDLSTDDKGIGFKMEDFDFSDAYVFKYLDYILISCKKDSEVNNKTIVYNQKLKTFDLIDYAASFFTVNNGNLWIGDSASPNVYEIFSDFDDLEYSIEGEWISKNDNLNIKALKKYKRFRVSGIIGVSQSFDIYVKHDNDDEELIGTVLGNANYVNKAKSYLIGSRLIGEDIIGSDSNEEAFYFKTEFKIKSPKFLVTTIIFRPKGIGYLAILDYEFADIRIKADKISKKYKNTQD